MKKLLTIALALICMAVLTGLAAGQGAQQKDKQKSPPPSETKPEAKKHTAVQYARVPTKVMKGTVGNVDEKKKAFNVKGEDGKESTFSGAELKALPKPAQFVEVTYTETSGVLKATTINITKSTPKGRVQIDSDWNENKRSATADVERPKDGATAPLPGQGAQQKDKQKSPPPSGETKPAPTKPPAAETTGKWSRDNGTEETLTGTVTQSNEKDKTFTLTPKGRWTGSWAARAGKEVKVSGRTLKALPAVGDVIDVTFIQTTSGGPLEARRFSRVLMQQGRVQLDADWNEQQKAKLEAQQKAMKESKQEESKQKTSTSGETKSAATKPPAASAEKQATENKIEKKMKGVVTKVDDTAETFNVKGDGKELTFRATALKTAELKRGLSGLPTITELKALLKSGELVEVTYTETSGQLLKGKRIYVGNLSRIGVSHSPK